MAEQIVASSIAAPGFMGVNTQDSSVTLESGFATQALNCVIDKFGRIGARKGWTTYLPSNSDLSTADVETIAEIQSPTGTNQLFAAGNNKLFLSTGTALAVKPVRNTGDTADLSYTISDSHWQVASIPDNTNVKARAVIVQEGQEALVLSYSAVTSSYIFRRLGDLATLPNVPVAHTTSTFIPNCA
jgi:hypothetical protein